MSKPRDLNDNSITKPKSPVVVIAMIHLNPLDNRARNLSITFDLGSISGAGVANASATTTRLNAHKSKTIAPSV